MMRRSPRLTTVMLLAACAATWTLSGCAADVSSPPSPPPAVAPPVNWPAAQPAKPPAALRRNAYSALKIAQLETLEQFWYFDMHGNAHDDLQALQLARFDATGEIIHAIDRLERQQRQADRTELLNALYTVLGFVQDPASIEWLRDKTRTTAGRSDRFYRRWLPMFAGGAGGYDRWDWLEERDRWIAFLIETFEREPREEWRAELLDVLVRLDNASVARFFATLNGRPLGHRETLIVETYERLHGRPGSDARLRAAIDALAPDRANHQVLIEAAHWLPHPAFVPFLARFVERESEDRSTVPLRSAQDALGGITFEVLSGKEEWRRWLAAHGSEGREVWRLRAVEKMRGLLARDEKAAVEFFNRAIYYWDDMSLLPLIEQDMVTRPAFRSLVASWIAMVYRRPYHARLEPLARKLLPHVAWLDQWAREMLLGTGYIPGWEKGKWADHVESENNYI
jgi:hypothetical protein